MLSLLEELQIQEFLQLIDAQSHPQGVIPSEAVVQA